MTVKLYDLVPQIKLPALIMAGNGGPDGAHSRVPYEGLLYEIFNEPEHPQVLADLEA